MFEIIKNVPMPVKYGSETYPFQDMEIGDCFEVPIVAGRNKHGYIQEQVKLSQAGIYWGKKLGFKFSTRKVGDVIRIWRTA